jgi:TusA-related sulfurtransferase
MEFSEKLDISSCYSPLDILQIKKSLSKISSGQVLLVTGLKPKNFTVIVHWLERVGHTLLQDEKNQITNCFYIKKK